MFTYFRMDDDYPSARHDAFGLPPDISAADPVLTYPLRPDSRRSFARAGIPPREQLGSASKARRVARRMNPRVLGAVCGRRWGDVSEASADQSEPLQPDSTQPSGTIALKFLRTVCGLAPVTPALTCINALIQTLKRNSTG